MNANNNKLISIEGNIGSGKSTLLAELQEIYASNPKIVFLKEPVDDWAEIRDANGITMLEKFYANKERYSFPFQMMAFISRLSVLKKAMSEHKDCVIITERSLYTDKCVFAQMLYDSKDIEDVNYQIYLKWFDEFSKEFPVDQVVYVRANPETCHERIKTRSRTGESTISLDYLQDCHQYHDEFINHLSCKVVSLDGNANIFEKKYTLKTWIQLINRIILANMPEGFVTTYISSSSY